MSFLSLPRPVQPLHLRAGTPAPRASLGLLWVASCAPGQSLNRVQLFEAPGTVAARLLCPWDSPGKNPRVGCHFLLQETFPTQGSNPPFLGLVQADSLSLSKDALWVESGSYKLTDVITPESQRVTSRGVESLQTRSEGDLTGNRALVDVVRV